ncbi:MAG: SDR family NAD(P)-dependent oxidoreductase [Spirochaetota bacterium]
MISTPSPGESTRQLFGIEGKVAVVTGAANGIGRTIATGLSRLGARVALVDIDEGGIAALRDEIEAAGAEALAVPTDLTKEESAEAMAAAVVEGLGGIDILVNAAGVLYNEQAIDFDMEKWQWVMDVNVKGTFLACRAVGRRMLTSGGGRIINFSSIRSIQGKDEYHAYAPSKGAVNQLTRTLAIEWAKENINVNAVAPTFTLTELNRKLLENREMHDWVLGRIPKGQLLEMEWLVGPVAFLASEASRFMTGTILFVDGGWSAA